MITRLAPDGRGAPRFESECPRCRLVRKLIGEQQEWLDYEIWKIEIGYLGLLLHWATNGWWTREILNKPEPRLPK